MCKATSVCLSLANAHKRFTALSYTLAYLLPDPFIHNIRIPL